MLFTEPRFAAFMRPLLAHPRLVWIVVALAVALALPTLDVGLIGDDLPQAEFLRAQAEGSSTAPWWDMFVLVADGDKGAAIAAGELPWWTAPELRVAFFRPVSVATHQLDYRLWPDSPAAMHLHSAGWYALCCALAWFAARRVCSSEVVAGIAALIFVGAGAHLVPVGWLAHRNALLATAGSLLCLLAHDRWRRGGARWAGILAPCGLALALLAGEAGVVALALILAHAACFDSGTLRERAWAVAPSLLTILVWRLLYDALGYGALSSGAYLDPLADPLGFARVAPGRWLNLMMLGTGLPFDARVPLGLWRGLALGLLASAGIFAWRSERAAARFGVGVAALGCVPLCASVPFERLLVTTSFGMAIVWAELLDAWLLAAGPGRTRVLAWVVVGVELVVSPLAFARRGAELDSLQLRGDVGADDERWLAGDRLEHEWVLVVDTPNYLALDYLERARARRKEALPRGLFVLHAGLERAQLRQLDAQTLEMRAPSGWPGGAVTEFWRDPRRAPFVVGETIETAAFVAKVEAVAGGRATQVVFHFFVPLDDRSLRWGVWRGQRHRRIHPGDW